MIRVLAVDDEEPFRRLLKKELTRKGFFVDVASEGGEAMEKLSEDNFDVVLLDMLMPGIEGLQMMKELKDIPSAPPIIVITGNATIETAVDAMKNGAYDYLTKPYKLDELEIIINRAHEFSKLKLKSKLFQQELLRTENTSELLIGNSESFSETINLINKISPTNSTVLIQGESGTGKELVARSIWKKSSRSDKPFVALNCASLSEHLMESELFGHIKGAFTDAYKTKYGIVEVADKGTLFLDEVAEMPLGLQAKLLRFLDSGEFRRVGSNTPYNVDVRVLAATNRDLLEMVSMKEFREDLFYRLNVINITVSPLRERIDDVKELSLFFIRKYSQKLNKNISGILKDALDILHDYNWPGNVRELENIIERAVTLCDSSELNSEDISLGPKKTSINKSAYSHDKIEDNNELPMLEDMERNYILKVLEEAGGNQSKASKILGINRKTLYHKLKKYGITDI